MKKTLLGKVTFGLTCVCLCLFFAVKILDICGLGRSLGGFENMMKFFIEAYKQGDGMTGLVFACKTFLLPIIWIWAGLLYILTIKSNRPIKEFVCLFSALAVFAEFLLLVAGNNRFFWQLAARCGFVIVFVLLFLELKKAGFRRWIYITFGLTYILTLVYVIRYMINVIRILSADAGIELFYAALAYIIHPAVFLVVAVLVLGYILFPEKYMEA